ncbi:FAD-dependent oxidoreductase [Microbacterium gilvum]|uniref:NAD(P)/FAD-dependent oxidoreductase n=1 Tax=Microbacterium gilvum TaxID=1336204 RepID=A0ABP9A6T2_9MICO
MSAHDVAIVGGGPVGLALACLLAQRGVDVVVRERAEAPSPLTRAIGIHPPGLAVLDAVGIGDAVRAEAVAIPGGAALRRGRTLGRLRFRDPVLSLTQDRTERLLEARLRELAPRALARGVEVGAVHLAPDAVEIEDSRGGASARVLVGADGARSLVRDAAGIRWERRDPDVAFVMADAADDTGSGAVAAIHLEREGVVESFPLPGGRRRWVVRTDDPAARSRAGFAAVVRARTGAVLSALGEPSPFAARQRIAEQFARGRVVLVGDAAHEMSPIGGQGMNLGWLDAAAFADAVGDGRERAEPWAAYADARREAALLAQRRARFNMAMGAPRSGAALLVRDAAVRMIALPPAHRAAEGAFTMRGL